MKFIKLTEKEISDFFMKDLTLAKLSLADHEIAHMWKHNRYLPDTFSTYLGVTTEDGELVAMVKYEWFTAIAINFHMYVASRHQKTHLVTKVAKAIKKYFIKNVNAKKALILVPGSCQHIHIFVPKFGWEKEGIIKDCMPWRMKMTDIVIYSLDISGD